jgi:nucleotide-binding universal stress UspA family protein
MYKRVLVPIDGSPWSDAAMTFATALATYLHAQLSILTVLTTPAPYTVPDAAVSSDLVLESIERQGRDLLTQAALQVQRAGVAPETFCKWGNVAETIQETAMEASSDLIILGARLITGWKRLMLGNVTNAVAAHITQPVLVVKQETPPTGETLQWQRVLVATGGSPWSDAAVDHALLLAKTLQFEVCLLHVEPKRRWFATDMHVQAKGEQILAVAEARAALAGVSYEAHVTRGNVPEAILETAHAKVCDVIILGARGISGLKRLMLGNITNAVAAKASVPVLIVKYFLGVPS